MPGPGARTELSRRVDLSLVVDADHYEVLVQKVIREARHSLWISTANVKEMRIEPPLGSVARAKGRYVSILDTFDELLARGVEIRFLHAGTPSRAFRAELDRHPRLVKHLAMRQCPRVHLKMVAVDGSELYLGSANFTGAGLGAKGQGRRNFELGMLTRDDVLLDVAQARFDRIWSGGECGACKLRAVCPRPLDLPPPVPVAKRARGRAPSSGLEGRVDEGRHIPDAGRKQQEQAGQQDDDDQREEERSLARRKVLKDAEHRPKPGSESPKEAGKSAHPSAEAGPRTGLRMSTSSTTSRSIGRVRKKDNASRDD